MPNIVLIVEVAPDAPELVRAAFAAILPGSIAVAVARDRAVVVDYEGGLYTRPPALPPSEAEQIEYALRAAGRAVQRYPTVARFSLPDWQPLRVVGSVDTQAWAVALRRPEPVFLIDGMPLPAVFACHGGNDGPCPSSVAGRFPGLRVLGACNSADTGQPGDLFPACGLQQISHLGHWQDHQGEHYPDELLPLRLFKCARGCWLVIPGLRHDRPAVYWPA